MSVPRFPPLPSIRDLKKMYRLSAVKELSQNFLLNEQLTDKIVRKAGNLTGACVLEVGPGPGSLTRSILRQRPKKLIVVEKDRRFKPVLEMLSDTSSCLNCSMDIILDDIKNVNLSNIFPIEDKVDWHGKPPNIFIIGNLPFNVSTYLIIEWLRAISTRTGPWSYGRTKMTLTFQKEVAERLVAPEKNVQRCRLSVMAQTWTYPIFNFIIPGKAFVPSPDVDVGVVSFMPLINPKTDHKFEFYEKVTRKMFSFRQKYSFACARTLFPPSNQKELATVMFKLARLEPTIRPTQLTVADMNNLASAYKYLIEKHPDIEHYDNRASSTLRGRKYTKNVQVEEYVEQ